MATRIQVRRDTASNWTTANPVLGIGEFGYDTTNKLVKIGDGSTAWGDLIAIPSATDITNVNSTLNSINDDLTILNDHIADGGTDKHTAAQVGLGNVLNAEQVRADASGYSSVVSPASGDKIFMKKASDGTLGTIPWSSIPSAASAMTSVEGAAGTDVTPKIISPLVLAQTITARAPGGGTVTTVNSISPSSGNVTLTQDNIPNGSTNKVYTATEQTKLAGIEAGATTDKECFTNSSTSPFLATNTITLATGTSAKVLIPSTAIQRGIKNGTVGDITVHGPEGIVAAGSTFNNVNFAWTIATETGIIPTTSQDKFITSFWLRPTTKAVSQYIWSTYGGANAGYVEIAYGSSTFGTEYIQIDCAKPATPATVTLRQRTAVNLFPADTWKHVLISVDMSGVTPICHVVVDGVLLTLPQTGYTPVLLGNETFQMTGTTLRVNLRGNGVGNTLDAAIAQLYIAFGVSLDLTNATNIQKFYNAGPVNLGFNGWRPLGTPPNIFMNGDASAFQENIALRPTASPHNATITGTPSSPPVAISGVSPAGTINESPYITLASGGSTNLIRQSGTINYQTW